MKNPLDGKHIVLGVTGSIAAYKACDLASKLTQFGALVDVILTPAAEKFITPLSFSSVTGRKAYTDSDLWGGEAHILHVGLGRSTDLVVIAPASANTIAKLAHGIADNLLTISSLAAQSPIIIAPAMDAGMYGHSATQANIKILKSRAVEFIGPAEGRMASGLVGLGRFVEPGDILGHIRWKMSRNGPLNGKKVVVTAGGTQESIDPVRVLTNRSSGKQGYAVAQAALDAGAEVILVSAPTGLSAPVGAKVIDVRTAEQMLQSTVAECAAADVLIMSAAIADFRPINSEKQKIKKSTDFSNIAVEPTKDVLMEIARKKEKTGFPKVVVGFAAESKELTSNAKQKLAEKKLDMIVANDITKTDAGFEVDTNQVLLITKDGTTETTPLLKKIEIAEIIMDRIISWIRKV
jgi:phosphopantothenoylcysteine decarboxylase/phosphopantothenate--cysteine ligase